MLVFPFFGRSEGGRRKATEKEGQSQELCGCESLSVIVPAYNEEAKISGALRSAQSSRDAKCATEVIVVDGGSTDKTRDIARSMGAQVIEAPKGRATQLNAGARIAKGDVLLFLHSDCVLPSGYETLVLDAMCPPDRGSPAPPPNAASFPSKASQVRSRQPAPPSWGAFGRLALDGPGPGLRMVEKGVEMRTRWKGLPYGDQGIFIHRRLFEEIGGYPEMPLMEDYKLVHDLNKHSPPKLVDAAVTASARRWEKKGILQTTITNQCIIMAYKLGVPPSQLAAWYRNEERCFWHFWKNDKEGS